MSLYRTYRPTSFADVIGQDHVVTTLENAVSQGKLAHAYLFAGSRGTGKTTVARILAKAMLTHGLEEGVIRTQIEEGVDDGSLVDLVEIDAASNRGIDDIRSLVEKIQFSPVAAAAKVYIIDEVHMLTREAFNALLKTLEEPPAYAYFILATTELQKIPATIQSRCQRFTFRQVRDDDIITRLQYIADTEHIEIERPALRSIARHAQGGMRDAISLLDQLRSLPRVTAEDVKERTGETGQDYVDPLFDALRSKDRKAIVELIRKAEQAGIPLDALAREMLTRVRGQLHESVERGESIQSHARMLQLLLDCIRDIRVAPLPGLVMEAALLSLCDDGFAPVSAPSAPIRIEQKKEEKTKAAPAASEPKPTTVKKAEATPAPTAELTAPDLTMDALKREWPNVLAALKTPAVRMSLKNGRVRDLQGTIVTLTFSAAFHRDRVAHIDAAREVEEALDSIFHAPLRLECILEEERRTEAVADADLVNVAEAAAEVF